jgi:carbonic anhydrase/acetyltransferase-like protein (isoleucine patch superfamily)
VVQRFINVGLAVGMLVSMTFGVLGWRGKHEAETRLRANVPASFNPTIDEPRLGAGTYIDPLASVIGDVRLGRRVMVAPFASIRGDEGQPIRIGSRTNIQDGVVLHALETLDNGHVNENNLVEHNGKQYAIYIGDEVSLAHQSQVHGPAKVGDRVFVGMQSLVFKAEIGEGSVLEPAAKVIGVKVPPGHYVPAGAVITTQAQADALPVITADYAYRTINDGVIHVNTQLADGYLGNGKTEPSDTAPKTGHGTAAATRNESAGGHSSGSDRSPTPVRSPSPTATPAASGTARAFLTPSPASTPIAGGQTTAGGH